MPLTHKQFQKIWLISDTILYPEAVALVRRLIQVERCRPLSPSQINGLLQLAEGSSYTDLYSRVIHQRERNWVGIKYDIKTFYIELEKVLSDMHNKRLRDEFHLVTKVSTTQEVEEMMSLLAREFIQHLLAENGLFDAANKDERDRTRTYKKG